MNFITISIGNDLLYKKSHKRDILFEEWLGICTRFILLNLKKGEIYR